MILDVGLRISEAGIFAARVAPSSDTPQIPALALPEYFFLSHLGRLHQSEQVKLDPVHLHLAVHYAVELHASEGHFLAARRDALELAAVGAIEGHTRRNLLPLGRDVLHREPKVGERLREGAAELPPGLQALQRAWGSRDVSYEAGSQDSRFGLPVALVIRLDPPADDGLVLF